MRKTNITPLNVYLFNVKTPLGDLVELQLHVMTDNGRTPAHSMTEHCSRDLL
jgi:hypothetical protein